jgi:hypothetical protein
MDQGRAYGRLAFDYHYGQLAGRSVEPGALVVSDWLPATVLWYTQLIESGIPAETEPQAQITVADPLEGLWQASAEGALAAGRSVYLARPVMGAADYYALSSAGPLVRVLAERQTVLPEMTHPLDATKEGTGEIHLRGASLTLAPPGAESTVVELEGGTAEESLVEVGSKLGVTLYWQADRPPSADYSVRLRLIGKGTSGDSHTWLERHNRHPVGGTYPTSRWRDAEVVADYYGLALPYHLASGVYRLQASLGIPALSGPGQSEVDWATLATLRVTAPQASLPSLSVPVRRLFEGGLVLTGYAAPAQVSAADRVSVALQWSVCTCPRGNYSQDATGWNGRSAQDPRWPKLVLVTQDGTEREAKPLARIPQDWLPGAQVVELYELVIPEDLAGLEVRGGKGGQEMPLCCQAGLPGRGVTRYRLDVQISHEPLPGTNLGNQVRLRGYAYSRPTYRPGETMGLTLEWEAMAPMDEAYKVFVHVLGANGLPIAQQDSEPLNGTYPTTRWQRGERVSDRYAISLPSDLSPGEYAVEVGLYRISDLGRLPVLDAEGQPVDDKVYLSPLTIK